MRQANAADWLSEAHGLSAGQEDALRVAELIVRTHANIEREVHKIAAEAGRLFDVRAESFDALCRGESTKP
jgi:hypothetical protein